MAKNEHCPDHKVCNFNCDTCDHGMKYTYLHQEIERLNNELTALKKTEQPLANWWSITYTNANGNTLPPRPMTPEELRRIGALVAAGAVCGVINDK